ncbi:sialin, putative [Pediculus humanus corporis]|uniref:Sialin n=1 Tax=Pediculus humanus subsp. corporis TaxID=121224 RepID=E0VNS5_PEDHC|nr:sialin, putative [Pediculus humanus corporis]EEB15031.1 sialin, putative [Pediculus humanus corporis]
MIFLIPQRYILAIMGFLAIANAYQLRVCLNIAITQMVVPKNSTGNPPLNDNLFDWSEETQSIILGAFYYGYVITHMPGGIVADHFGGKYTLGLGILCTAIFTLLVPLAAKSGVVWLIVARVITGFGEGTTFPALNVLLARWIPLEERGFLGSLVFAGSQIGSIIGILLSGFLLESYKDQWEIVFYVFGGIGIGWFVLWTLLCYSEPECHPYISDEEKNFLKQHIIKPPKKRPSPPWKKVFTSVPLWALIFGQIGHDWGFYTMVTDLPKYMQNVLNFKISENGIVSSIPYAVMWIVSMSSGWLADFLIKKKLLNVTNTRKLFTTIAHVGPSITLIAASYAGEDRVVVVTLFAMTLGLMGTFYPGMKINALDLSPNFAGTLMAVINGIGGITGIISPLIVAVLAPNQTDASEWRLVFWITLGINAITGLVFIFFGSGELQPWNDHGFSKEEIDEEKKDEKKLEENNS